MDYKGTIVILVLALVYARYGRNVNKTSPLPAARTYDYIVVGGGTAGAIVASRLSEDPSHTVLLVEAGIDDLDHDAVPSEKYVPLQFFDTQKTVIDWQYQSEPQQHACKSMNDQKSNWPRGKILGGSSSINAMQYVRGHYGDYDSWDKLGAKGWNYKEVFPYFKASVDATGMKYIKKDVHGFNGLHKLSESSSYHLPYSLVYMDALKELGYETGKDVNAGDNVGFGYAQHAINNGIRETSATAFLSSSVRSRQNLEIITKAHVTKVIIESNEAVGVEYVSNNRKRSVLCKKEIILSAGAIGSPHILLLSGIGPKRQLLKFGIPVHADLPVGMNLQDHPMVDAVYYSTDPKYVITLDKAESLPTQLQYMLFKTGLFSNPLGTDIHGFIRTKLRGKYEQSPDIQLTLLGSGAAILGTDKVRNYLNIEYQESDAFFGDDNKVSQFTIYATHLHPKSVGSIELRSGDPFDHPVIQPNFLKEKHDVDTLVEGVKEMLKLNDTSVFKSHGFRIIQKIPLGCEKHAWGTNAFWECYVRHHTITMYHPIGTCKMGQAKDSTTVVDEKLKVKGISGLRVIDASVMPHLTSGNTNAPTMMIAEKGSDMIKNGE